MTDSFPAPTDPAPGCLPVPLSQLTARWPRSIREELAVHPPGAVLSIPLDELAEALRHGRVRFPWNRVRGWIVPAVRRGSPERGERLLELPLPVVAPLFAAFNGGE